MRPHHHTDGKGEPLVATALASGCLYEEAAHIGGVSLGTVKRRMLDPAYREHIYQLRGELLAQSLGVLANNCAGAANRLQELMHSDSDLVAQKAARSVLEMAMRMKQQVELEARLTTLEKKIEREQRLKGVSHGGG